MEILSSMTTRTDSGSGVRHKSGSGVDANSSRFEKMFEEELAKYESRFIEKDLNTEDNGKELKSGLETNKEENKDNSDEALAAGVMGNLQNEVINILEGDSKSAITYEQRIENIAEPPPETTQTVKPEINTESPEYVQVENAVKAEATMTKPVEVNTEHSSNSTGEVMARMPETRTQDSQNDKEQDSKFFEKGNPSPLENENDETQVKGQTEKTYSDAADAAKSAVENKAEPIITSNEIAPPLSEGIKPEQFQATQQMTQAALNTPVKTENLFEEMISRVEMMQNDTKSAMTIQLNPEFLGKVALEVSIDAAGLHVKINAEDSGVRSMINGQLTALLESLENKGLEVAEVEVVYTGVNNGAFKEPGDNHQHQSKHHRPANREVSSTEGAAYYTTLADLQDYYLETGVSSVEYSA